jgi:hypothetical protein
VSPLRRAPPRPGLTAAFACERACDAAFTSTANIILTRFKEPPLVTPTGSALVCIDIPPTTLPSAGIALKMRCQMKRRQPPKAVAAGQRLQSRILAATIGRGARV